MGLCTSRCLGHRWVHQCLLWLQTYTCSNGTHRRSCPRDLTCSNCFLEEIHVHGWCTIYCTSEPGWWDAKPHQLYWPEHLVHFKEGAWGYNTFLDVEIIHNLDGSLSTRLHWEPTSTDQYLQLSSHHPLAHSWLVVSTVLKRAVFHCSTEQLKQEEKLYVRKMLGWNGYPERFFFPKCSPSTREHTEKKAPKAHRMIPYVQGISEAVARILSDLDVMVHMKPWCTQRNILSHPNDKVSDADKSNVVYKISCGDCDASYVSEISRAPKTRLLEHRKAVEKADFFTSALAEHAWDHGHRIDWTNTCILCVDLHYHPRLPKEAI